MGFVSCGVSAAVWTERCGSEMAVDSVHDSSALRLFPDDFTPSLRAV
jgi:hypothetical protein